MNSRIKIWFAIVQIVLNLSLAAYALVLWLHLLFAGKPAEALPYLAAMGWFVYSGQRVARK